MLQPHEAVAHVLQGYPTFFLKLSKRYEALRIAPYKLPERAWRTVRQSAQTAALVAPRRATPAARDARLRGWAAPRSSGAP